MTKTPRPALTNRTESESGWRHPEVTREDSEPRRQALRPRSVWMVLGCSLVAVLTAFAFDPMLVAWQHDLPSGIRKLAGTVSDFGDWPALAMVAAACILVSYAIRSVGFRRVAICMLLASTLAGLAANALKHTTGRARPNAERVEPGWHGPVYDGKPTAGRSKLNSFPSGHTAVYVGFFGYLLFTRLPFALLGVLLLPVIPLARLASGAHFLSDVVVALVFALLAGFYVRHRGYRRFLVTAAGVRALLASRLRAGRVKT